MKNESATEEAARQELKLIQGIHNSTILHKWTKSSCCGQKSDLTNGEADDWKDLSSEQGGIVTIVVSNIIMITTESVILTHSSQIHLRADAEQIILFVLTRVFAAFGHWTQ